MYVIDYEIENRKKVYSEVIAELKIKSKEKKKEK